MRRNTTAAVMVTGSTNAPSRTVPRLPRSAAITAFDSPGSSAASTTVSGAMEELVVGSGWTGGHPRRVDCDFHYALRLKGRGNHGYPAGNNGDLFVTVTVED